MSDIERIEGVIKWYNPQKGFGFIIKDQEFPDIFLHFSILDMVGVKDICKGDRIICDIQKSYTGYQVTKIYEIKFNHEYDECEYSDEFEVIGEVKWYNYQKGFGFIFSDEDHSEIYMHSSILHPAMYQDLIPGRKVIVTYFENGRGKEAKEIKFI